jgi:hypothetical protein
MRARLLSASLTFLILFQYSCHSHSGQTDSQSLTGTYQGKLGTSVATIVINYINKDIVSGYDVIKGVRRNLNGKLTEKGATVDFDLTDPGDNGKDGHYLMTLDTLKHTLNGTWKPMHPDKATEQSLSLKRRTMVQGNNASNDITDNIWAGGEKDNPGGTLSFSDDGLCQFDYYKNDKDSTDQLNTIKGTFILSKKSVTVEWEKNDLFTAPKTTLRLVDSVINPYYPNDIVHTLTGSGLLFTTAPDL